MNDFNHFEFNHKNDIFYKRIGVSSHNMHFSQCYCCGNIVYLQCAALDGKCSISCDSDV